MEKKSIFDSGADLSIKITMAIAVFSGFAIVVLTAVQIITRTFFNFATAGLEEMCRYLLVTVTYFGAAYTLREGGHVSIDLIQKRISAKAKARLHLVHCVLALGFCLVMAYCSGILTWQNYIFGSLSSSMYRVPLVIPTAIVPLGFFSLFVVYLSMTVKSIRGQAE
jgi:TRAP-type C4-dicarboxylate transport system permease small subunit